MLYYKRIDINKRINLGKSNRSKECMICHYWFFDNALKFQDFVYNGCHDSSDIWGLLVQLGRG